MSDIVCQVGSQADQVEFIWSSRGGYFQPYVLKGTRFAELRQAADRSATGPSMSAKPSCREALETLVLALNQAGVDSPPWERSYELAEAGFRLFNCLLPPEDGTACKVLQWLEEQRKQSGLIGLEIVVEERAADAQAFLSIPWNLVYDERPATHKAAFQTGQGVERWRPFWSARYNLTSARRVEPLKRAPVWVDPRVVVVVDPTVHAELDDIQKQRLDGFLAETGLTAVGSLAELEAALEAGYPRLLYWLGHATPDYLMLADERIAPADLRNLLRSFGNRERPEGMLAFLNACQTAEAGSGGSFLDVLHSFGFTGAIATERQTIDTFANQFGLDFLRGFLREGKPLGELLHGLRLKSAPLGLVYGAHCPPEIRVRSGDQAADIPALLPIHESGPVSGVALGATAKQRRQRRRHDRRSPKKPAPPPVVVLPLPEQPYPSLAYYDWNDRALFTGRDADILRFAATLDRPDTRILILHGESGTGKSSFLRAGVIPYLEEECVGYRFFRRPDGSVLIIQAIKDLVGQLAQALLDATATPLRYVTPDGEPHSVNLRQLLDKALGTTADYTSLSTQLGSDPQLLANILTRMASRLPHALVLVLDQAEEVFTLARTPDEVARRDHGLRMLQRLVDVQADVKLIVSLRTEYYGRLLDQLRAGRRDLTGVRDDLLRDFSRSALIESITRPTFEAKYRFRYAEGIPALIADGVLAMRSENQDGVLPLAQVICTQLYERKKSLPGSDEVITREDLDAIKHVEGNPLAFVEGGLKAFAEDALVRSMRLSPEDSQAFKGLFSQLFNTQPDGTLTTWLMPRKNLENQWDRPTPFADLLEAAKSVRLLREDELRIEGGEPRRYVRLGHDALAKVAASWKAEREARQRLEQERAKRLRQRQRLAGVAVFFLILAALFGLLGVAEHREAVRARKAELRATIAEERAQREAVNAKQAAWEAKRQERVAGMRAREASEREHETQNMLSFVENKILAAVRPKGEAGGLGREVTLRTTLEEALPEVETAFQGQPRVEASLRATLAGSFWCLGDTARAEQQLKIVRALHTARLGPDSPVTLSTMNDLAICYATLGRHAEALALREETLSLQKAKLGPHHPDTVRSMINLANSYHDLGRFTDALKLREETLALKARLSPDDPDTLLCMNNLAVSYSAVGRDAEALKLHLETLARRKAKLGPDHPDTLASMQGLAASYAYIGRNTEAFTLRAVTLKLWQAKLGPDHPNTLSCMSDLANSYADLGRHADALNLREKIVALRTAKLGPDHPNTLSSMNNLANSYADLGRKAEALTLREKTLALRTAKLGPDHPDTLSSMNNLANSYADLGRNADALTLRDKTLAMRKAKLGPDHPDTLWSMYRLAQSLVVLDRPSESLPIIDDCLRPAEARVVVPRFVPSILILRLRACAKQNDPAGCRQTAELWDKLRRHDAGGLYNAACFRAVTASVTRADKQRPDAGQRADAEADTAMSWLAKAVAAGFYSPQNLADMMRDHDLDDLRDRADFRRLTAKLFDRGFPTQPFTR